MATPTVTPSFSTLLELYRDSHSVPSSPRESPEGSPYPQGQEEEEKEGHSTKNIEKRFLISLEGEGSMHLSSIRLSQKGKQPIRPGPRSRPPPLKLTKFRRGSTKSRVHVALHPDLFTDPSEQSHFKISPEENKETLLWMLEAQDLILSSQNNKILLAQKLINKCKEIPSHVESHRLYIHLHVLTNQQIKTERLFLEHIKQFPKDVLIWKIFVTFLKKVPILKKNETCFRYSLEGIINLLNHSKLQMLQNLSWFKETQNSLSNLKRGSNDRKISQTLKSCVELFQENLDPWAQWTLEAEDALTRCYRKVVQEGKPPLEIQLTPRRGKAILDPLIRRFEDFSHTPLPVEIHRLCLRLKLISSDKIEEPVREYRKKIKDYLAEYHILSSIMSHGDFISAFNRCIEIIPRFPYLSWIEKIVGDVQEEQKK